MRMLFVWSAAEFSTFDVARGWRNAFAKIPDLEIRDFKLFNQMKYHASALKVLNSEMYNDAPLLSRLATEYVVVEALQQRSDIVFIVSGLSFHPNGLWLLKRVGIPTAVVHTESPYEDEQQYEFSKLVNVTFTNDKHSADRFGWYYVGSSYDPAVHKLVRPRKRDACDVVFIGTGWPERQKLLEGVDWTGIRLRILGLWPTLKEDSPLWKFYTPCTIDNEESSKYYAAAKIAIVHHRGSKEAQSLGPRSYEIAAAGAFQVSDYRPEIKEIFGHTVPVYSSSTELERSVRYWLAQTGRRTQLALEQRQKLLSREHTFNDKTPGVLQVLAETARERVGNPRFRV